jgi:hypothetical protein
MVCDGEEVDVTVPVQNLAKAHGTCVEHEFSVLAVEEA